MRQAFGHGRLGNPVRSRAPEVPRDCLRCRVAVGVEPRNRLPRPSSEIMQVCMDCHDDFPELRGPSRRFRCPCHEAGMVVDRLEQCGFKTVPNIEHAVAAIRKPARSIGADVGEWRHEVGGPVAADTAVNRNEVEVRSRRESRRASRWGCRASRTPEVGCRSGDRLAQSSRGEHLRATPRSSKSRYGGVPRAPSGRE